MTSHPLIPALSRRERARGEDSLHGRAFAVAPAVLGAAMFALVAVVLGQHIRTMLSIPGVFDDNRCGLVDFRDQAYYPAVSLLEGNNPYDATSHMRRYPAVKVFAPYSPIILAVFLPFGLLPLWLAQSLYYLFTLGLLVLLATVTLNACGRRPTVAAVSTVATLTLASRPGEWNALLGQFGVLGALGACVALYYGQARPWVAGLGLAVSLFKPTYGVPVAVLMLAQRDRRAAGIGLATAGAVSVAVVAALAHSAGGIEPFLRSLGAGYSAWRAESADPLGTVHRVDAAALVAQVLGRWPGVAADLGVSMALVGLGALLVRRIVDGGEHGGARGLAASVGSLVVLTGIYHLTYDQVLLVPPIIWLMTHARPWRGTYGAAGHALILALLLLPMVNYLASERVAAALGMTGASWHAVTTASSSTPVLGLFLWAVVVLRTARENA